MALIHQRMTTEQADEPFCGHIIIAREAVMPQSCEEERVTDGSDSRTRDKTQKTLKLGFLAGMCEGLHSPLS